MKTFCGFLNMFDNIPDFVIPVFTSGNNFYYQTYNDKDDIQYFKLKQNPRLYNGIALSIVGGFIYNGKMLKSVSAALRIKEIFKIFRFAV